MKRSRISWAIVAVSAVFGASLAHAAAPVRVVPGSQAKPPISAYPQACISPKPPVPVLVRPTLPPGTDKC